MEHESESEVASIEAKIVHDADALDKCGPLGVIRHIWKMTNMLENHPLTEISDLSNLEKHLESRRVNLQTDFAKKIAKDLNIFAVLFFVNKDHALKQMKEISRLAWEGKTSDKIAERLVKNNKGSWFDELKKQLDTGMVEV